MERSDKVEVRWCMLVVNASKRRAVSGTRFGWFDERMAAGQEWVE